MKKKITKKQKTKRLCKLTALCAILSVFAIYLIAGIIPPSIVDYSDVFIEYVEEDYKTVFDEYTDLDIGQGGVKIERSGAYRISGELKDGSIYIASAYDEAVYLILDNALISCSTAPAVYISGASKVVFVTTDGSKNEIVTTVSSGSESAIYSDADVTFNGNGSLSISSENGIAVNCNTSVRFTSGEYRIKAKENGVKAAYGVALKNGTVSIESGSDAIKTTTGGKSNGKWYGVVDIGGGKLNITSDGDGINSNSMICIGDAEVNITCSGGSIEIEESNFLWRYAVWQQ